MKILSCAFNMDTACVELKFDDGTMIAIDTIAVENEVAENMYQRSSLFFSIIFQKSFLRVSKIGIGVCVQDRP